MTLLCTESCGCLPKPLLSRSAEFLCYTPGLYATIRHLHAADILEHSFRTERLPVRHCTLPYAPRGFWDTPHTSALYAGHAGNRSPSSFTPCQERASCGAPCSLYASDVPMLFPAHIPWEHPGPLPTVSGAFWERQGYTPLYTACTPPGFWRNQCWISTPAYTPLFAAYTRNVF